MQNIQYYPNRKIELNCGQYTLMLGSKTYVMGILNVTPDSFSDGGNYLNVEKAIIHAQKMVLEGADIIDIGGESTRPGAGEVSADVELSRLLPVLERLVKEVKVPISVDTYKAEVAEKVLQAGAHIINDVWGLQRDLDMAGVIAKYDVPVIVMHNQSGTKYDKDIMESISDFFKKSINMALEAGVKKEKIILDPGIGFGKNPEQNMEIMARLGEFNALGHSILLGTSRKSMIGKILDLPPEQRVEGTLATSVMGIVQGVDIIRVHDIVENVRTVKVTDAIVRLKQHG
ncbi:dihydropteroate synthase FolP [Clostridium aceticum]|uniref:Dihydropteroate synthase n=1 Tax=Clostridium aceticum TaxID=84022 RepID=A0A0G3WAG2_9CLOT|nr:dihydropteroate synthase [Clostridium aceticum]AKL94429.1 dihydropteroate synthase FolP [Clostridium aceticum]